MAEKEAVVDESPVGQEQMTVNIKGPAPDVMKRLGGNQQVAQPVERDDEIPADRRKFLAALSDPKNIVTIKRTAPRQLDDGTKVNTEIFRESCPMTYQDIIDELRSNHGGRKYRVGIVDQSGEIVAADRIEIDADPILPDNSADEETMRHMMEHGDTVGDPADITARQLDNEALILAKTTAAERNKQLLEEIRGTKKPDAKPTDGNDRFASLEIRIIESEYKAKLAALEAKVESQHSNSGGGSNQLLTMLLEQSKKSDERFERMMQQMQNNAMNDIKARIEALANKPAEKNNTMLEMADTMLKMKDLFGWGGDDDDGSDDDDPNKPWYERLADKFMPDLIDLIKERADKGNPMSKEEMVAQFNAAADRASAESVQRIQHQQPPALPAPPQVKQPTAVQVPAPQVQLPPPPTVSKETLVLTPPPPAAPAPEQDVPSIEDEIAMRVAQVLMIFEREMILRPRQWQWTSAFWATLPEDTLEKACAATNPVTLIGAFAGIIKPEKLAELTTKAEPAKIAAWIQRGLNELSAWAEEFAKDATFDPLADPDDNQEATA